MEQDTTPDKLLPELFAADYIFPVDGHPNARAQRVFAELLAQKLAEK